MCNAGPEAFLMPPISIRVLHPSAVAQVKSKQSAEVARCRGHVFCPQTLLRLSHTPAYNYYDMYH
jgi:hypothetical protein